EFQRAVLHLKPDKVVVLGGFAITGDIELRLRKTKNLLAFQKLLFGRVIEFRLGSGLRGLCRRGDGGNDQSANRGNCEYGRSHRRRSSLHRREKYIPKSAAKERRESRAGTELDISDSDPRF